MSPRVRLLALQLPATLVILAWVPGNVTKLMALLLLWGLTFRRLSRAELVLAAGACLFFTLMNLAALRQGIFAFRHPDVLGLPAYEFVMWGFYLLHTQRVLAGPLPPPPRGFTWALAAAYAAAFALVADPAALLMVSGALLLAGLVRYHQPMDLAYVAYMTLLGAAIEYTGVWSGQWYYPGDPPGGVPPWFLTLWGGVGLFLRRLLWPLVARHEPAGIPH
ncbi:MAG: hypothetical protein RMK60_11225 [Burkholderiales bacterium]|nr:hypothetical protein [Burkholderiales bacterium]